MLSASTRSVGSPAVLVNTSCVPVSVPIADQESGSFWLDPDSEGEDDGTSFVPLPRQMLDDLRVDLAVRIDSSSDE